MICLLMAGGSLGQNLARNPGMEEELAGTWECYSWICQVEKTSDDPYDGDFSIHVKNR